MYLATHGFCCTSNSKDSVLSHTHQTKRHNRKRISTPSNNKCIEWINGWNDKWMIDGLMDE